MEESRALAQTVFWLREAHALELLVIAGCLSYAYRVFTNRALKRVLFRSVIWLVLFAICRSVTPVVDFYTNRGYGVVSLTANVIFFFFPCYTVVSFVVRIWTGAISRAALAIRVDSFVDALIRDLRVNVNRTDELADDVTHRG